MSKNRKSNKKKRRPNLSPLSLLRPRLDGLLGNPDWTALDNHVLAADLDAVIKGIEAEAYLPVIVKAYQATPEAVQARLDELMPLWLEETEGIDALYQLTARFTFEGEEQSTAMRWLEAAHADVDALEAERTNTFYKAFQSQDEFGSQGLFVFFYYSNQQHSQVRGFNLLLDYNPPWEGAAKDTLVYPQRRPQDAVQSFVYDMWGSRGLVFDELNATEAKEALIEIFLRNRAQGIRLHQDITRLRSIFVRHVFSLPDGPKTPPFTISDFDALSQLEKRTEEIMHFEQTVGRRVRMDDGKELLIRDMREEEDDFF